ncbi:MAG TPA: M1 family aminopeptidase [Patescibacteria group bacterium]|nr:M1 family aminopeptidase [Patescibacteria group bacterium]
MFGEFFRFELKYHFSRISTYIYFVIFFALGFLAINATAGAFENVSVGGSSSKVFANAPSPTFAIISIFSYFGVMIIAAIVGTAVYRDYEHNTHALFYTAPISKFGYLGGRFAGSMLVVMLIFTGIALGLFIGSFMPWLDRTRFGPYNLLAYLQPYFVAVIPNTIFIGAMFFALATISRNILATYVAAIVLLLGYLAAGNLLSNIENETLAALIDPFGNAATDLETRYWTVAEQNTLLVPFRGNILLNRAIWTGIGLFILGFVFKKFSFGQFVSEKKSKKIREAEVVEAPAHALILPKVSQHFSFKNSLFQMFRTASEEFRGIVMDMYFIIIGFAGVIFIFISATQLNSLYGTSVYPVTYSVLSLGVGSFILFQIIIITFYAGQLVWKERELRIDQIYDALPTAGWMPFLSKFIALIGVQAALLFVVMVSGILVQAFQGYFNFEIDLYIKELFGLHLLNLSLICALTMFIHVMVNNKYTGHFVMVLYYLLMIFLPQLGVEHNMLRFGADTGYTYSDMNGYGHFMGPHLWFNFYWAAFAVLLAIVSNLFWVRSTETSWKARTIGFKRRLSRGVLSTSFATFAVFAGTGSYIFYNTNILNDYKSSKALEKEQVEFERKYKKFENMVQPRLKSVKVNADIFPEQLALKIRGKYMVKNQSGAPIDSLLVNLPSDAKIHSIAFSKPTSVVLNDKGLGFYIYKLSTPLQPNDSLEMNFDLGYKPDGFSHDGINTSVVHNGTFFNSDRMPSLGYVEGAEISDDDLRKKHGLKPKERMAPVDDQHARQNTYISNFADWIDFEATVSTSPDQIALAPGYLQREWTEGGRRYFHYTMDSPILNFYSFLSAKYQVRRDKWNDVAIEVYYHKGHEYNIDRMIHAVKKSLDYYTANFSPYQHRQVRILEFPRYATFAQSFPNTIPYSESLGFIAKVDPNDEEDIDYPFYVTAHEIAHQWWAHQVIGGNVQGATLLSESMSQYSALMVMEKEYGREKIEKFLKYELQSYLSGRTFERKKEVPLALVENQQYIHYNKGSLILYALRDYIGEEQLNGALRNYISSVKFQQPPYTNSTEFLSYLRAATPDTLQYLISDMFEKITLFDNKVTAATFKKLPDGKYAVDLTIEAQKLYADSLGREADAAINDWIDIGIFGEGKKKELYLSKHKIDSKAKNIRVVVNEKPVKVGIDPYHKLIDRKPDDNVKAVSQ